MTSSHGNVRRTGGKLGSCPDDCPWRFAGSLIGAAEEGRIENETQPMDGTNMVAIVRVPRPYQSCDQAVCCDACSRHRKRTQPHSRCSKPMKVILDCDAGLDDAMAIIMALHKVKKGEVDILAITCVQGNTTVDNSSRNVLRVLKAMGMEHIPVHKGARQALVQPYVWTHPPFHGRNGFGDVPFPDEPDVSRIREEHAVAAMLRLVKQHRGEITLILTGPLTNAALAMRMDHDFTCKLKAICAMGGNFEALGTTPKKSPEFNFAADPEAAFVVLSGVSCPLHLYTWELSVNRMAFPLEWRRNLLKKIDTPQARLQDHIEAPSLNPYDLPEYIVCDQLTVAGAINPDLVLETSAHHVTIELSDPRERGRTIVDIGMRPGEKQNVVFVERMDKQRLEEMIIEAYCG